MPTQEEIIANVKQQLFTAHNAHASIASANGLIPQKTKPRFNHEDTWLDDEHRLFSTQCRVSSRWVHPTITLQVIISITRTITWASGNDEYRVGTDAPTITFKTPHINSKNVFSRWRSEYIYCMTTSEFSDHLNKFITNGITAPSETAKIIEPYTFHEPYITVDGHNNTKCIYCRTQVNYARCVGLVNLDDKGFVTRAIERHDSNTWFFMDCNNHLGATFNLLYNGTDKFYLTKRITKFEPNLRIKIISDINHKVSFRPGDISTIDQEALRLAVQLWLDTI